MPLFDLSVLAGGVVRAPLHEPLHSPHPTLSMAMPARKCACIEMRWVRVPGHVASAGARCARTDTPVKVFPDPCAHTGIRP